MYDQRKRVPQPELNMSLEFTEHKNIVLRKNPDFSEAWLHDRICENTSMLKLGDLSVVERERTQYTGGRLDILLSDGDSTRYEVEVMLGATDPSHIIRVIEYWDVERRRYPAYEHIAVLIAEEVTSRFLNVMSLLAGSIPLIAIQLNAIQVGDKLALDFVKVLDQRALREDDTVDATEGDEVGRPAWEKKVGENGVALCDELVSLLQPHTDCELGLRFQKRHVPVVPVGTTRDVAFVVWPRRTFMRIQVRAENLVALQDQLNKVGIDANMVWGGTRLRFNITAEDIATQSETIIDVLTDVIRQKGY